MENKYRNLHDLPMTLRVEELMPILGKYEASVSDGRSVSHGMPCWSSCGSKCFHR